MVVVVVVIRGRGLGGGGGGGSKEAPEKTGLGTSEGCGDATGRVRPTRLAIGRPRSWRPACGSPASLFN